jgi:ribosomal protein S18 acetylase RimI-like enzyme
MDLSLRHIVEGSEDFEYASDLYDFSFPKKEQEKMDRILKISESPLGDFSVILEGDTRVGLLFYMKSRRLVYIYYLAIDPGYRGRGYGSRVLSMIEEMYPDCGFTLNSEAPDDMAENNEQRMERIAFYERNGFRDSGRRRTWDGVRYAQMVKGRVGRLELWLLFKRAYSL